MLRRRLHLAEERGTTLVELLIGTSLGLVVLSALTMLMIVSMHASARVSDRVHATQNARLSMTKIIEQLHSACVTPKIAPIQAGSSGTVLKFSHALQSEGSSATAKTIFSTVALDGNKLVQTDYPSLGGTPPVPSETAIGTQTLASNVTPTPPSSKVFTYYRYSLGQLEEIKQQELGTTDANSVIQVKVAFTGFPPGTPTNDGGVGASVQNSAMLRLTPPSFQEAAGSPPCQ